MELASWLIFAGFFAAGLVIGYLISMIGNDGVLNIDDEDPENCMYLAISKIPSKRYVRLKVNKIHLEAPSNFPRNTGF